MNSQKKIVKLPTLKKHLSRLREEGRTIAFTNGCFDILHYGHVHYLEQAKKNDDRILVLGLNDDRSIRSIKGKDRPIVPERGRSRVLAGLACVDFVVLFSEDTPLKLITAVQPDILLKGADWKDKGIVGADVVKASGGRIEYIKFEDNYSTTNIVQTILTKCVQ